ncbi:HD domain-containing protein [Microlunatus parietis]|uniref:Putative hydrolase of HD superfamily n=1 Tax=Microlunatus parietis TaxID=682979 RepID=A0A7Y9I7A0_9ACTN|nr:HD domain-containing protein [Microlunatus parietis]NYE71074.1 putative hydrolase of HD superfamily [Microlunatus parietis]
MINDRDATAVASFAYELGVLKRLRRAGWWQVGVRDPESVSEHSLRVAQLAALVAAEEDADPVRSSYLGIWHDSQETRICDLPHSARAYLATMPDHEQITRDQLAELPESLAKSILDAVIEYEAAETREALCARDADKLECLIQAVEYRHAGYQDVQAWIDSSRRSLRTSFAGRIADAALDLSPLTWLSTPDPATAADRATP